MLFCSRMEGVDPLYTLQEMASFPFFLVLCVGWQNTLHCLSLLQSKTLLQSTAHLQYCFPQEQKELSVTYTSVTAGNGTRENRGLCSAASSASFGRGKVWTMQPSSKPCTTDVEANSVASCSVKGTSVEQVSASWTLTGICAQEVWSDWTVPPAGLGPSA